MSATILEKDVTFEKVEPTHILEFVDAPISQELIDKFKSAWDIVHKQVMAEHTYRVTPFKEIEFTKKDLDKAQVDVLGKAMPMARDAHGESESE